MKKIISTPAALLRALVAFTLVLLLPNVTAAQPSQNLSAKLDEYLNAHLAQGTFSGTVAVTQNGKTIYSKGFGMADYEKGIPNGTDVKYRIGSVTKSFTAILIMQLQERGKLNVQDKLSKYLPDFPNSDKITLQQLLTHTAGLPDYVTMWKDVNTKPATNQQIIAFFKDNKLEFEPGTKWKYSSTGYILLGRVIEVVTGKPYEKVLARQILKPLKMHTAGLEFSAPVQGMAKGYNHDGLERKPARYIDMSWCHAAGGMYATPTDLAKLDEGLRSGKLLKEASLKEMFTPVMKNYGYGWVIDSVHNTLRISHSGAINGFKANFIRLPQQNIAITIMSNYESQQVNGPISADITAIVLGAPYEVPVARQVVLLSPEKLAAYVGEYQVGPKMVFTVTLTDNLLYVSAGPESFPIFPEEEDKFFVKVAPAQVTFEKDADGRITKMYMHHKGKAMPATRLN
ncbi:serine hydrolase [Pontibacter sp. Tf4]|uniref:serine hydrolase n=1 Tax=Pontibacter sp. Tf4 TaxID=2761620 RepID=UPI001629C04C|nr:serine hydrolase [Pontibacter sp. Tf4]MBB6609657.1 serine hydrolase [Pontibacter sp. Tf4]